MPGAQTQSHIAHMQQLALVHCKRTYTINTTHTRNHWHTHARGHVHQHTNTPRHATGTPPGTPQAHPRPAGSSWGSWRLAAPRGFVSPSAQEGRINTARSWHTPGTPPRHTPRHKIVPKTPKNGLKLPKNVTYGCTSTKIFTST